MNIDRQERVVHYYPNRNEDGLIQRTEKIGSKVIEKYQNREDLVIHTSIKFYICISEVDAAKTNN